MTTRIARTSDSRVQLWNTFLTGVLLVSGLMLTAVATWLTQHNSFYLWETASVAEAERLSAELHYRVLRNREPLIAVSSLYSGSDDVTQAELSGAREQILEITGLAVEHSLAFVVAAGQNERSGQRRYTAAQVAGTLDLLPADAGHEIDIRLLPAIEAALDTPGELILDAFIRIDDISYLPIATTTHNAETPGTLLYLLNLTQLLNIVTQDVVAPGTTLSLFHPQTGQINHSALPPLATEPEASHVLAIDMGLYQWQLVWSFDADNVTSVDQRLSYAIALGGTLTTLLLSFIIYNLLHQRQIIGQQIEKKTRELHETQALLIQREKMAALGQMVAGISHDLNTPIGNSLLAATLLRTRSKDLANTLLDNTGMVTGHDRQEAIETFVSVATESTRLIEKNIQRATELIRSFKLVAVDQSSDRRRRFNLHETLQEMEHTLAPGLRAERLQFTIESPSSIEMDSFPGALYQVISNLVTNAITHAYNQTHDLRTPYRGELLLQVTSLDKEHILMKFSDDGTGIDAAVSDQIFDPFFTTRLGSGGSGLGLHIVFTLVTEVLGGDIKLLPVEQGTGFRIVLPLVAPGSKKESKKEPRKEQKK